MGVAMDEAIWAINAASCALVSGLGVRRLVDEKRGKPIWVRLGYAVLTIGACAIVLSPAPVDFAQALLALGMALVMLSNNGSRR